ncbi:MAG: hypothetical protein K0Q79_1250 [Flavipsychrobacter sp.]|nr:hypothetical protein [Flavipsychrobacter sp.]
MGKWFAVKQENAGMNNFFEQTQKFIDTMGKGHDDVTNIAIYGVANMDSVRRVMQVQLDSTKKAHAEALSKTAFAFMPNHFARVELAGEADTCKWVLDHDNGLIFEERIEGNYMIISRYQIVELSKDELKLRFYEEVRGGIDSSTVTFNRQGK